MKEVLNMGYSVIISLFIGLILLLGFFFFKGVAVVYKENKIAKNKNK